LAPPPAAATPPQRVAPPQPPALPAAPIVPRRLAPVVVEDAATLGAGRLHLRLPGVVAVPLDETCRDAAGQIWPCGRRALAAIRAFVRGRTVTCPLPKTARTGTFDVACTIGGIDLATWAVEQGWARPDESSETARAAAETAQREGRGVHRSVAPPVAPLPDAGPNGVDVPPDRTTAPLAGGTAEAPPRVVEAPARALPPTVEAAPLPPVTVAPPPVPPASVSRPLAAGPEGPMRLIP
ncbi:thermonuclease family protein, partial [Siculibacillus lacustris]|uniref:thermonuclease family protein n=1 Tax=Siculibacillus lacustris TaxID=1549641 RepID=UPI00389A84D6